MRFATHLLFEGADAVQDRKTVGFDMRKIISSYINDESGAAAAEYALILAILGAGIVAATGVLGGAISDAMVRAADVMDTVLPAAPASP